MIDWKHDPVNKTWEGRVGDELLYDIEPTFEGAILYLVKKHVGNYLEFPSVGAAKKHCDKLATPKTKR